MKVIFTLLFISVLNFFVDNVSANPTEITNNASRAIQVVPNVNAGVAATSTFLGPLANADRTYQLLIHASQLTGLVGENLTGISFRLPTSATANWPATGITYTYASYDIYLSGSVNPADRVFTFALNIAPPAQVQVRSGPLTILPESYTLAGVPNEFGTEIKFNTPWLYSGGNLLVEIRHTGFTGTSRSVEAVGTAIPGYGTDFSACWTGNYTGTTGAQGNFSVIKLTTDHTLDLTCLIEGLYNELTNTMVSDVAKVYLRNFLPPYDLVNSAEAVLDSDGEGSFIFLNAVKDEDYYVVVSQRNSIDTWSASNINFTGSSLSYDFTSASTSAYGENLKLEGAEWTIFSGDVNKDGIIDLSDILLVSNDASDFVVGYVVTDVNGDLAVTLEDLLITYNNAAAFVEVKSPL